MKTITTKQYLQTLKKQNYSNKKHIAFAFRIPQYSSGVTITETEYRHKFVLSMHLFKLTAIFQVKWEVVEICLL